MIIVFVLTIIMIIYGVIWIIYKNKNTFKTTTKFLTDYKNVNIDFDYYEIEKSHDLVVRYNIHNFLYEIPVVALNIYALILMLKHRNMEYNLLFIFIFIISLIFFKVLNKKCNIIIKKCDLLYNEVINNYIKKQFNYIEDSNISLEEINSIFKKKNKKSEEGYIDFAYKCKINDKKIYFMRYTNGYKYKRTGEYYNSIYYYFKGYIIKVENFDNLEALNTIKNNNYLYDNQNKVLYLLISDEINHYMNLLNDNSRYSRTFSPKFYLKRFKKNSFLSKNICYFSNIRKFLDALLIKND